MDYVELHKQGTGIKIRLVRASGIEEPFVSNPVFVGPVLGELGVRTLGPWEDETGDDGVTFQRAVVLG